MGNRSISFGDATFSWDDVHLILSKNGAEEWRISWLSIAKVAISDSRPLSYTFYCADSNEGLVAQGNHRCRKLETLLLSSNINVFDERTNKELQPRRWLLRNHLAVGSLPDTSGNGHLFAYKYELAMEAVMLVQSIYCAVMSAFFLAILYLTIHMLYQGLRWYGIDASFVAVFAGLSCLALPFTLRSPILHYRSKRSRHLLLLFVEGKLYVVNGDKRQEATISKKKLPFLGEYCIVESGGKKHVFDLLMKEQR